MMHKLRGLRHRIKRGGVVRWASAAGLGARAALVSEIECNTAAIADANISLPGGFGSLYLGGIEVSRGLRLDLSECSKENQLQRLERENPIGSYYADSTANWTNIDLCTKPINIGRAVSHLGRPFQKHSSLAKRMDAW